jgi:uncharacterized protein (TIGR03578 family)
VQDDHQIIIRLEPLSVNVIQAKEISYTEYFLFFFFPRKRTKYQYVLNIMVRVSLLNVAGIQHEQQIQENDILGFIKYKVKKFRQVK